MIDTRKSINLFFCYYFSTDWLRHHITWEGILLTFSVQSRLYSDSNRLNAFIHIAVHYYML